jgi:AcrR family transcriptional regulator
MKQVSHSHPAQQARSRASHDRLLNATLDILKTGGLDAATIPRIAAKAGLSPGSVYRRFPDKDALLREALIQFFEKVSVSGQNMANESKWKGRSLAIITHTLVSEMLQSYRKNASLLRAAIRFTEHDSDLSFRRYIQAMQVRTFERMVELYVKRREEIHHPDPAYAARFGLMMASFAARDFILALGAEPEMAALVGYSDKRLERELTRALLGYLQVKP